MRHIKLFASRKNRHTLAPPLLRKIRPLSLSLSLLPSPFLPAAKPAGLWAIYRAPKKAQPGLRKFPLMFAVLQLAARQPISNSSLCDFKNPHAYFVALKNMWLLKLVLSKKHVIKAFFGSNVKSWNRRGSNTTLPSGMFSLFSFAKWRERWKEKRWNCGARARERHTQSTPPYCHRMHHKTRGPSHLSPNADSLEWAVALLQRCFEKCTKGVG